MFSGTIKYTLIAFGFDKCLESHTPNAWHPNKVCYFLKVFQLMYSLQIKLKEFCRRWIKTKLERLSKHCLKKLKVIQNPNSFSWNMIPTLPANAQLTCCMSKLNKNRMLGISLSLKCSGSITTGAEVFSNLLLHRCIYKRCRVWNSAAINVVSGGACKPSLRNLSVM